MKRFLIVVAGCLGTLGCANQSAPVARHGVAGAANAVGSSDAIVVRTLLSAGVPYSSKHNTMVRLEGDGANVDAPEFSVIFGPHDAAYLKGRIPVPPEGAAPPPRAGVDPEGAEGIGTPDNNTLNPSWTSEAGYALLWGWWPVGYTPTVRVVTEGRGAFLMLIEKGRERIVRISGATIKVTSVDGAMLHQTISNDMHFVDVTWDANGSPKYSIPAQVPGGSALESFLKLVLQRKQLLTP